MSGAAPGLRRWSGLLAALCLLAPAGASPQTLNAQLSGDLAPTHDPAIIRAGDTYYVYNTIGHYIGIKTSPDLKHWTAAGSALADIPAWARQAISDAQGLWAPDISYENGEYRLYYAVSSFGSNQSAIGLATNPTLDPASKDYRWTDRGMVIESHAGDDFNAIDPNLAVDADGGQWLALGSFWSGIKLFRVDSRTGKPALGAKPWSIARRPVPAGAPDAIEAPFIFRHGGWYYLLTSFDYCCKGASSTYYTVIARSKAITGPYLGKDGSKATEGGGTVLIRADLKEQGRFRGPGHPGVLTDTDGTTYVAYHAYDKHRDGAPTLRIARLNWGADGWPVADY